MVSLPAVLKTLGDHIRTVRVSRGLLQKEVADIIGVNECSVTNWENGKTMPFFSFYPAIHAFLGYYPFEHETETINGKFLQWRRCQGLPILTFCKQYRVDSRTVRKWETRESTPPAAWCERIMCMWQLLPDYLKIQKSKHYEKETSTTLVQ